jgi:hypothetical protein
MYLYSCVPDTTQAFLQESLELDSEAFDFVKRAALTKQAYEEFYSYWLSESLPNHFSPQGPLRVYFEVFLR